MYIHTCEVYETYLEVINTPVISLSIPYHVLRSCILLALHGEGGYRAEGQDAGMDIEITKQWSYYSIPIVSIPCDNVRLYVYLKLITKYLLEPEGTGFLSSSINFI